MQIGGHLEQIIRIDCCQEPVEIFLLPKRTDIPVESQPLRTSGHLQLLSLRFAAHVQVTI